MMRSRWLIVTVVMAVLTACGPAPATGDRESGSASAANAGATGIRFLSEGDDSGFARATTSRAFTFPADHGSHDEFRSEWWYFTGNVDDAAGAHFGFELTFFRIALTPEAPTAQSGWRANQVWMAHFALTDVARGRFLTAERFARGSLGLAGANVSPFRVWVKDWSVEGFADASGADLVVSAGDANTSLALRLNALKPPIAQGDGGLDAKGPEAGNASYYYSLPRIAVTGSIELDGIRTAVTGSAWMDREWGTSALSPGVVGWDWFALQLSDGRDLMFYRLRQADGGASPFSGGSLIDAAGESQRLGADDVQLAVVDYWTSEHTGVRYPVAWRLEIPAEDIALEIEPYLENQEVDLSVRYWEGAVHAAGRGRRLPLTAQGYLELAGY